MTTTELTAGDVDTSTPESMQDHLNRLSAHITAQDTLVAELRANGDRTQRQLIDAQDRYELAARQHRTDITAIGERLLEEAEERRWCEQYDTVVDELNEQLTVELPVREKDHEVELDIRVTIQVSARGTSDAVERAGEIVRQIERDIDARPGCTSDPDDSSDWDAQLA